MKIYVVETVYDYLVQYGFALSREKAQKVADKFNKKQKEDYNKFFVTEYEVGKDGFCEFDSY